MSKTGRPRKELVRERAYKVYAIIEEAGGSISKAELGRKLGMSKSCSEKVLTPLQSYGLLVWEDSTHVGIMQ